MPTSPAASVTELQRLLAEALEQEGCTVESIIDVIRDQVRLNPDVFTELFPTESFVGSVRPRAEATAVQERMTRAGQKGNQLRAERRDERRDLVMGFVRALPNHETMTYTELAAALNKSQIQPARGGAWSQHMVFRLIGSERGE